MEKKINSFVTKWEHKKTGKVLVGLAHEGFRTISVILW